MSIKIYVNDKEGKTIDELEFCCYDSLSVWLEGFKNLPACDECKNKGCDE